MGYGNDLFDVQQPLALVRGDYFARGGDLPLSFQDLRRAASPMMRNVNRRACQINHWLCGGHMAETVPMTFHLPAQTSPQFYLEVASSLLDADLHPDQVAKFEVNDLDAQHLGEKFPTSFQFASIKRYVSAQNALKETFENALRELEPDEPGLTGDVWKRVSVREVLVGKLKVPTADGLAVMREQFYPGETLGQVAARFATPGTEDEFEVVLDADWDDEHVRLAHFRDGRLLSFTVA